MNKRWIRNKKIKKKTPKKACTTSINGTPPPFQSNVSAAAKPSNQQIRRYYQETAEDYRRADGKSRLFRGNCLCYGRWTCCWMKRKHSSLTSTRWSRFILLKVMHDSYERLNVQPSLSWNRIDLLRKANEEIEGNENFKFAYADLHGNLKFILNKPLNKKYFKHFRSEKTLSAYCEGRWILVNLLVKLGSSHVSAIVFYLFLILFLFSNICLVLNFKYFANLSWNEKVNW